MFFLRRFAVVSLKTDFCRLYLLYEGRGQAEVTVAEIIHTK